jgi:hypothetical protein
VSARHVSWLETGKANPSREMVLVLASALDLPLRERNELLLAADFAPAYAETPLDADAMADVRHALHLLMTGHEPYPVVVMNRAWSILCVNRGFCALHHAMTGVDLPPYALLERGPNLIDAFFTEYAPFLDDPQDVLSHVLPRLRREASREPEIARRLERWLGTPRATASERSRVVVPIGVRIEGGIVRLFTTFTALGTPTDITTEELTIEMFHPADADSAAFFGR